MGPETASAHIRCCLKQPVPLLAQVTPSSARSPESGSSDTGDPHLQAHRSAAAATAATRR
eukprot:scaffold1418_cov352-Prasinococcus_capsulatus_cf.AAC.2